MLKLLQLLHFVSFTFIGQQFAFVFQTHNGLNVAECCIKDKMWTNFTDRCMLFEHFILQIPYDT